MLSPDARAISTARQAQDERSTHSAVIRFSPGSPERRHAHLELAFRQRHARGRRARIGARRITWVRSAFQRTAYPRARTASGLSVSSRSTSRRKQVRAACVRRADRAPSRPSAATSRARMLEPGAGRHRRCASCRSQELQHAARRAWPSPAADRAPQPVRQLRGVAASHRERAPASRRTPAGRSSGVHAACEQLEARVGRCDEPLAQAIDAVARTRPSPPPPAPRQPRVSVRAGRRRSQRW